MFAAVNVPKVIGSRKLSDNKMIKTLFTVLNLVGIKKREDKRKLPDYQLKNHKSVKFFRMTSLQLTVCQGKIMFKKAYKEQAT